MTFPRIPLLIAAVMSASVAAPPLYADELVLVPADMTFDDAAFSVETTIVGQGLQIEYTSHVGEMLERTRADMGSNVVPVKDESPSPKSLACSLEGRQQSEPDRQSGELRCTDS